MAFKKKALLIFGILFIFNICGVYAGLGITPATTNVDFKPNLSFLLNFHVLNAEPDTNLIIYADGDLSQYVTFDKTNITGQDGFTAYVDLPESISQSGKNRLYIKVKESAAEGAGVSALLEVGSLVLIKVPYPGKYAEINYFDVGNVNEGQPIYLGFEINNLGSEEINPDIKIEVFSNGKLFETYPIESKTIIPNTIQSFEEVINDNKYKSGSYEAFLYFGLNDVNQTILRANRTFNIGSLLIDITNWTKEVNKSKINPFNIEIESKWNNNLKNVYAEINVTRDGIGGDFFKTPSIELKKWEKGNLKGFLNAENLEEGKYNASIVLYYDDKTTNKVVGINVVSIENPLGSIIIVIIVLISVIAVVMVIVAYLILKKWNKKNAKKKNYRK